MADININPLLILSRQPVFLTEFYIAAVNGRSAFVHYGAASGWGPKGKGGKPTAEDGAAIMACYFSMKYRVHPIN